MRLELDYKIFPELGTFPRTEQDKDTPLMDGRVFWQDEIWVDRNRKIARLSDMTHTELLNVMKYLYDTVDAHYFSVLGNLSHGVALMETGAVFVSDEEFNEYNEHVDAMIAAEPHEWLNNTAFIRKIDNLLG